MRICYIASVHYLASNARQVFFELTPESPGLLRGEVTFVPYKGQPIAVWLVGKQNGIYEILASDYCKIDLRRLLIDCMEGGFAIVGFESPTEGTPPMHPEGAHLSESAQILAANETIHLLPRIG